MKKYQAFVMATIDSPEAVKHRAAVKNANIQRLKSDWFLPVVCLVCLIVICLDGWPV